MKKATLPVREIEAIAATRLILGIGVALLLSPRLTQHEKRWTGWAFFLLGAATTPLLIRSVYTKRIDE